MVIPLGTKKKPRRIFAWDTGEAAAAGTIASRSGRARVVPMPRTKLRREMHCLVMIMALVTSSSERACF